MLFLAMYLVSVVGNTLIVLAIGLDPYLHTPMYLFLANLSLADIASISTSVPKMLMNIQTKSPSISFESCITQMYFSIVFVVTDNFLLGVMACDHFVAICHPLNYTTIMGPGPAFGWPPPPGPSVTPSPWHTPFCSSDRPSMTAVLPRTSSATWPAAQGVLLGHGGQRALALCRGLTGHHPALRPPPRLLCLHHQGCPETLTLRGAVESLLHLWLSLTAVFLFFGTIVGVYFFPSSSDPDNRDKKAALLFTVVTPMMNPFIYSLRNKDMKGP